MGNVIINIDIWGLFGPTYLIARTKIALETSHTNSGQGFVPMSCHKLGIVLVSTNLCKVSDRSSSFPVNIRSLLRRPFEESNFCSSLQGEIYMICTETDRGTLWKLWWMPSKCRRWKIIRRLTQDTKNEGRPRINLILLVQNPISFLLLHPPLSSTNGKRVCAFVVRRTKSACVVIPAMKALWCAVLMLYF